MLEWPKYKSEYYFCEPSFIEFSELIFQQFVKKSKKFNEKEKLN